MIHEKKKMPGEFTPDHICVDGQFYGFPKEIDELNDLNIPDDEKCRRVDEILQKAEQESETQRHNFALYYCEGGNVYSFADFKGEVIKIKKDRICFRRIWMIYDLDDYECTTREGIEDHVWIFDVKPFRAAGATVGKCCKFNACAYAYKRTNGTVDFGLKCPENIEIIPRYELPDMKKIRIRDGIRSAEHLVCQTCVFTEQCYEKGSPVCIAAEGYREQQMKRILRSGQEEREQKTANIAKEEKDAGILGQTSQEF